MNWASAADFWAMGGYGFYVWGSYKALVIVVVIEVGFLIARRRAAVTESKRESIRN